MLRSLVVLEFPVGLHPIETNNPNNYSQFNDESGHNQTTKGFK